MLKRANITHRGSTIFIECEFTEKYPQASCVLVYREYDNALLTVVEFPHVLDFPVSVTVDDSHNYTFALFGKDEKTGIERDPVTIFMYSEAIGNKTLPSKFFHYCK